MLQYRQILSCLLNEMATNILIEGSWDDVMRVIGQAHTLVHENGVVRVQTVWNKKASKHQTPIHQLERRLL